MSSSYFVENFNFLIAINIIFVIFLLIRIYLSGKQLNRAYNIAVIGFPKSGKTTLITTIFGELFSGNILGIRTVPRGHETIERVNEDLKKLEIGRSLGPTTDQDLFAYRADIKIGRFPFQRKYKVEIGDFPGEDSEKFDDKFGEWFHNTPYFKWAMEADAFIFIIDLAQELSHPDTNNYKAKMSQSIRAAWQHLMEYHTEGKKSLIQKPVSLVFTKSDIMFRIEDIDNIHNDINYNNALTEAIMNLGFCEKLPKPIKIGPYPESHFRDIENKYKDVIDYLGNHSRKFSPVFVSPIAFSSEGKLGIKKLLKIILPRRIF